MPNESASSRLSLQGDMDLDGRDSQSSEYLKLSESFASLSTSADTTPVTPFTARTGPVFTSSLSSSPAKRKVEKYYAIIVGKCTGVYWNEW